MESTLRRTWAEINLDALIYNYNKIREKIGENVKFLGVVKADDYGHGLACDIVSHFDPPESLFNIQFLIRSRITRLLYNKFNAVFIRRNKAVS